MREIWRVSSVNEHVLVLAAQDQTWLLELVGQSTVTRLFMAPKDTRFITKLVTISLPRWSRVTFCKYCEMFQITGTNKI